jgi:predicted phosphoribosyltransferase
VLTLISFGAPAAKMATVAVSPTEAKAASGGVVENQSNDLIVIVDDGRYLGADMTPLAPGVINAHAGRVILAIDPATPLQAVIELRGQLQARDLVVVTLLAAWRAALATSKPVRQ